MGGRPDDICKTVLCAVVAHAIEGGLRFSAVDTNRKWIGITATQERKEVPASLPTCGS